MTPPPRPDNRKHPDPSSARPADVEWADRCAALFEEMRRPARAMVARAYGRALSDHEIEDVYSAAWAATLAALRTRGPAMVDGELRAYVLTAVASHASKEMRRRSRKPSSPLEGEREQLIADGHAPLPDEIVIGSEARGVARDLLTSLPPRRRAVMLLRYGWGLSPNEVCALVSGLSPRAYRKEVTRGVEQLIEGLRQVESGEWCESREPLVRDLVAGTADEATRRQATEHLDHCRACSELAARLSRHLHDVGGMVALSTVAGCIGEPGLTIVDRIVDLLDGGRDAAMDLIGRVDYGAGAVMASGGAKGSGAVGAGVFAKFAGAGGAGKAALACLGAGAAATACVAVGVVPGLSLRGPDESGRGPGVASNAADVRDLARLDPHRAVTSVAFVTDAVAKSEAAQDPPEPPPEHQDQETTQIAPPEPPSVATPVEEFDPIAADAVSTAASGSSASDAPSSSGSGVGTSANAVAQDEFGP